MKELDQIKVKFSEFVQKKAELIEQLRRDFPIILMPFFEQCSDSIQSISWNQYTPYFNDGDECKFSANVHYLEINGEWDAEPQGEDKTCVEELSKILSSVDDDFYRDMFGDHVTVTCHRNATITIQEYDHD